MSDLCLSPKELQDLTGRQRSSAQLMALNSMGITCKTRPDGSLAVSRLHALQVLGLSPEKDFVKKLEPNWDGLHA